MRAANITAAFAIVLWLGLAVLGRQTLIDFLVDDVADWPTMMSIDFSIVLPMSMASALLAWAWFCNTGERRPWALKLASVGMIAAILPYLMIFGGGV